MPITQDPILKVNFETVHNIDEWGTDFWPSMREALRGWNMTVITSFNPAQNRHPIMISWSPGLLN